MSVTDPIANIAFDHDIEAPYTDQYPIGVDRELIANIGRRRDLRAQDGREADRAGKTSAASTARARGPAGRTHGHGLPAAQRDQCTEVPAHERAGHLHALQRPGAHVEQANGRIAGRPIVLHLLEGRGADRTHRQQDPNHDINNDGRLATRSSAHGRRSSVVTRCRRSTCR